MTLGASTVAMVAARTPNRRSRDLSRTPSKRGSTQKQYLDRSFSLPQSCSIERNAKIVCPSTPNTPKRSKKTVVAVTPPQTKRSEIANSCDRFIPNRSNFSVDLSRASILSAEKKRRDDAAKKADNTDDGQVRATRDRVALTPIQAEFRRRMRCALFSLSGEEIQARKLFHRRSTNAASSSSDTNNPSSYSTVDDLNLGRVLTFGGSSSKSTSATNYSRQSGVYLPDPFDQDQLHVLDRHKYSPFKSSMGSSALPRSPKKGSWRRIPTTPSRVLDAPDLVDDYYLNLISWSAENILAVALGRCVYLWNASNGDIVHLVSLEGDDNYVTSVSWSDTVGNAHCLAVGTNEGYVQLWDTVGMRLIRTMDGHTARVGSLAWNQHCLSSGGRDSIIVQHDVRSRNHSTSTYRGHTQEVCGLKWNEDGSVLGSGGNENYLCLWDAAMSGASRNGNRNDNNSTNSVSPRFILTDHKAAVKALAFCPFNRHLLASGGGTADRCIKFWNTNSGAMLNSVDTGSQVCSLLWSKHNKEICSSHGFSENQLILWNYPTMTKIQEFTGHTSRVLHMAGSPDGATVVSAAADETLRFWDIFGSPPNKRKSDALGTSEFAQRMMTIR